jgi:flagellar hook protein FlgE
MGISALGAGLSGLNANQQALAVEAHNVANLNTEGYTPQAASFEESAPGGSGVSLSAAGMSMSRAEGGTDLASSMTNSLMYKAGFAMSLKVIQAADERMGMLIDIKA